MEKKTEEAGWKGFLKQCTNMKSEKDLDTLFTLFLTATERQEIAARYLIVKALLKGDKPQREIAEDLKVSIANISRGSNMLKITKPQLKKTLEDPV